MPAEKREGYKILDKRSEEEPTEVCRVCGSANVHTREYNNPTMRCIQHLRNMISYLEERYSIDTFKIEDFDNAPNKLQ